MSAIPTTSSSAFEALYRATVREVEQFAARRLPRDEVPDAVADVFSVMWRRWHDVPDPPADRYWLFGVARNVCSRASQRHTQSERRRGGNMDTDRDIYGGYEFASAVDEGESLRSAFQQLDREDQEILMLVCVEELDRSEVAHMLGCEVGTVNVRLFRARARLRSCLSRMSAEPGAVML